MWIMQGKFTEEAGCEPNFRVQEGTKGEGSHI